jgi:DNA repair protein RadC
MSTAMLAREDRAVYRAIRILEKRLREPGEMINSPQRVRDYLRLRLAGLDREVFVCLYLDAQNRVIDSETLFYGTLTQTEVHPREVVKRSLHHNAASVIFAHNHPSGVAEPSKADMLLTCALQDALALVSIRVLDHFIIAGLKALSFAERGILGLRELPEVAENRPAVHSAKRRSKSATSNKTVN